MFGIINTFKYLDHSFGITYSSIGNNNLDRLWGHSAAISVQIESVDDAKETGWQFSYGYDMKNFTNLNLNFKSLYAFFDRPDSLGNDKEEFNLEINYNPAAFKNFLCRAAFAYVREFERLKNPEDLKDYRIYLKYKF